ncbi:MAG: DUF92 domain-containing protein [Thermomicrobiales bacterium]|nr:DUF92 domain-containing protein [Thermomicrobiales bacterium]
MPRKLAIGLAAAASIALAAGSAKALAPSGAAAATLVGGAVFAGTGLRGGAALVAFFVSSSLLGRLPRREGVQAQRRGSERDAVQVLANGGIPAALALAASAAPSATCRVLLSGFGGAVAAATADTWATEIGSRYGGQARSIATLRPVPPGTSGGITLAGLGASVAGAALIATVTRCRGGKTRVAGSPALPIVVGGLCGSLCDSLLGATIQEVRFCDACCAETEALTHACGAPTRHLRGAAWCGNDLVNLIASGAGAAAAIITAIAADPRRGNRSVRQPVSQRGRASWRRETRREPLAFDKR